MDPFSPALDSTRVPPVDGLHGEHVNQIARHLRHASSRQGVTAEVVDEEAAVGRWLIECLRRAYFAVPPTSVSLPRGRANYTTSARKRVPFGYGAVTRVLNACLAMGWITVRTGSELAGYTRLSAAGELERHFAELGHVWIARAPMPMADLLRLGDKEEGIRRFVTDAEHPDCSRQRAALSAINNFLIRQCIYLRVPDTDRLTIGRALAHGQDRRDALVDFGNVDLYRVFTKSVDLGGRFYGGWWQSVPKAARRHIFINQWRGVECDFSGMALRCAYALEGLDPPDDPYDFGLPGYRGAEDARRAIIKRFVNASLNDKAKRFRLDAEEVQALGISQRALKDLMLKTHAPVAHQFFSDAGLRLQRLDADIAESVMLQLLQKSIVCLPVHDSFIVGFPYGQDLVAAMERAFLDATGRPARMAWAKPVALPHPFADGVISSDGRSALDHVRRELDSYGAADAYFRSWASIHWDEDDWDDAQGEVARLSAIISPELLAKFHAFPVRLFARKLDSWTAGSSIVTER